MYCGHYSDDDFNDDFQYMELHSAHSVEERMKQTKPQQQSKVFFIYFH